MLGGRRCSELAGWVGELGGNGDLDRLCVEDGEDGVGNGNENEGEGRSEDAALVERKKQKMTRKRLVTTTRSTAPPTPGRECPELLFCRSLLVVP